MVNPWVVALASLIGAGFIGFWCSHRRLWWPLLVLGLLLAVIAGQLYFAFRGTGGYHDLSALTAMNATVLPALLGMAVGVAAGERSGAGLIWRGWQGALMVAALAASCAAVIAAMRV